MIGAFALGWNARRLQALVLYAKPVLGPILCLIGLLVLTGLDKQLEAILVGIMPNWLVLFKPKY